MHNIQARSNLYALLSRVLLQELDDAMLDMIRSDGAILELMPNLQAWEPLRSEKNRVLQEEYLNPDFAYISLLHLIPYESFYVRDDQMVESGGANAVVDIYGAYDYVVDYEAARVVSADHIGVELEFMYHLCEAQSKAMVHNDTDAVHTLKEVQHRFLHTHLLQWAPLYLLSVKYEARTPLYADAADMALEFLLSDYEYLSAAISL